MEKLLESCAGFVKGKYGCTNYVIDLKSLFLEKRIDSSILKLAYNGTKKQKYACKFKTRIKKKQPEQ